jgi:hypothetical protein
MKYDFPFFELFCPILALKLAKSANISKKNFFAKKYYGYYKTQTKCDAEFEFLEKGANKITHKKF